MSRFTNDVDAVGEMLNTTIVQLVAGTITLIGTLGLMIYTNIWLTLITLVMIPIFTYASRSIIQFSRKPYSQQQTALGILDGFAQETINGQKVVKVFTREEIVKDEFRYLNDDLGQYYIKDSKVRKELEKRNSSVLAHGLRPVSKMNALKLYMRDKTPELYELVFS